MQDVKKDKKYKNTTWFGAISITGDIYFTA